MRENVFYDENTLHKVYGALRDVGLDDQRVTDAVSLMQNAGILFRERPRSETHCPNGHERTPENTGKHDEGSRRCKECRREAARKREERDKGKRKGQYGLTADDLRSVNAERFWSNVFKATTCWTWQGRTSGGYGTYYVNVARTYTTAHRVAWVLAGNELDSALQLDHLCRNTLCVNPEHLEPVTAATNNARATSPSSINGRKTHCIRGHAFTEENTYRDGKGRQCRTCRRENSRKGRVA